MEQFSKWLFSIPDTLVDERGVDRTLWIVPAPFLCMRYIKDTRYRAEDETTGMLKKHIEDSIMYHTSRYCL